MTEHFVRPDVRAYLDQFYAMNMPPFSDEMVAMMRQMPPGTMPSQDLPVGDLGEVRDVNMPGPGGDIALRMFDPRSTRGPSPVVVFYHGGGFVVGSIETHAGLAAEIARTLDLPVVSVEYRLAPENPWPAAPDDAEAAARWIGANGAAFGREFTSIVLAGDSAGGNLTAVTALALRDRPAALPLVLQLAFYPKTDSSQEFESDRLFGTGFLLEQRDMDYFIKAYAMDPVHPRGSPALFDLAGIAPTLVVTAGLDPLRDDGKAYADKLAVAGVPVKHINFAGTIHGFATFRLHIPSARQDLAQALDIAKNMLAEAMA